MVRGRSPNELLLSITRTAFNWSIYKSRSRSLRLLRRCKTLADTLLETEDGFSEAIHWQAVWALCPRLIKSSTVTTSNEKGCNVKRYLKLPSGVSGLLARKLVDCAYGELVSLNESTFCELFQLACNYRIDYVKTICLDYARGLLDINNCIRLFIIGLRHKHIRLKADSYSYIRQQFRQLLTLNRDFHLLSLEHLIKLLQDDSLRIDDQEELTWLAVVRWVERREMSSKEMLDTYNRMVSVPYFARPRNHTVQSFKTVSDMARQSVVGLMNFHIINSVVEVSKTKPITSPLLLNFLHNQSFKEDRQRYNESKLCELIRCLRFNRFHSVTAFEVIQSTQFIQASDQLTKLVEYMKLRYIIRNKLPVDKEQVENALPEGTFAKIHRSESTWLKRAINKTKKTVIVNLPPFYRPTGMDQDYTSVKPKVLAIKPLDKEVLSQLEPEDLRKAKEPRIPSYVALIIGGWRDKSVCNSILAYDHVFDKWFKLNVRLPEPRAFHASCSYKNHIFIMGGTDGRQILNSVLKFNPSKDVQLRAKCNPSRAIVCERCRKRGWHGIGYKFHRVPSMRERRCHFSAIAHTDNRIYAIGGHDGLMRLRTGERFSSGSDEWAPIADMTMARSDASACSYDNKIFVAGGQIGDHFIQASVEFYKPNDNTWTFAAPMIVPRMSFKLVAHRNYLLAIGGINGIMGDNVSSTTRTVERYNPAEMSWNFCAPLIQKRCSFGALSLDKELLVLGGRGGGQHLRSCEALKLGRLSSDTMSTRSIQSPIAPPGHPAASGWPPVYNQREPAAVRNAMQWIPRSSLPGKRSGFSVVLVEHLSSAREFTYHGSKHKPTWKWDRKNCETVIKQHSNWHRFKLVKRKKLVKHLKIALVIVIVYLIL